MKKVWNIILILLIIYLLISSIYICIHVNFKERPIAQQPVMPNKGINLTRIIMGLPIATTNYLRVHPIYLLSAGIRIIIATILGVYVYKRITLKNEFLKK